MPVLHFTESDKMAAKILEKGVYSVEVTKVGAPEKSGSGKSFTHAAKFMVNAGPYINKELEVMFNTGTSSNSMLGNRQYAPARDVMKVAAAALGVQLDDVPLDLDTDTLLGKTIDVQVDVVTSEGNLCNIIQMYAPHGKLSAGAAL